MTTSPTAASKGASHSAFLFALKGDPTWRGASEKEFELGDFNEQSLLSPLQIDRILNMDN